MAVERTQARIRYLLAIYQLAGSGEGQVRSIDIASRLKLQKSSVSTRLKELVDKGLVTKAPYGKVALTEEGRAQAQSLLSDCKEVERFLERSLAITPESAQPVAVAILSEADQSFLTAVGRSNRNLV